MKYSPGVRVVTSGMRNICIPVKKFVQRFDPLVVLKVVVPPVEFVTQLKATLAELEACDRVPVIPKLAVVHWLMLVEFAPKSCRVKKGSPWEYENLFVADEFWELIPGALTFSDFRTFA